MGLFSFFNKKYGHLNGANPSFESTKPTIEIPENIFVEKERPTETNNGTEIAPKVEVGINMLYNFLEKNYESKGYDDALINPDTTHLQQNIDALRSDLARTIRKVKTFYEDFIKEINFHIASRSRSGMIDTVEELEMKKQIAVDHINQVIEIEEQARQHLGLGESIIISYTRGFKNGLAAISHHSILKRNF